MDYIDECTFTGVKFFLDGGRAITSRPVPFFSELTPLYLQAVETGDAGQDESYTWLKRMCGVETEQQMVAALLPSKASFTGRQGPLVSLAQQALEQVGTSSACSSCLLLRGVHV